MNTSDYMTATNERININCGERVIPDEAAAVNEVMTVLQHDLPPIAAAINQAAQKISAIRDMYSLTNAQICGAVDYLLDERGPLGAGTDPIGDYPFELLEGVAQAIIHKILLSK